MNSTLTYFSHNVNDFLESNLNKKHQNSVEFMKIIIYLRDIYLKNFHPLMEFKFETTKLVVPTENEQMANV